MRHGLALNVIVGPNEAHELDRGLQSYDARKTFDEIVIVRTSQDKDVLEAALTYTTPEKTPYHPWTSERYPYGDFAGARNVALDITESDWFWWHDADDFCQDRYRDKLQTIKRNILAAPDHAEVFKLPYIVRENPDGTPAMSFNRERIIRRIPKFRWRWPVHERVLPPQGVPRDREGNVSGFCNTHRPMKLQYQSALRNVAILEHEDKINGGRNKEMRYFLGRDLMLAGRAAEGCEVLVDLMEEMDLPPQVLASAAIAILLYRTYGAQKARPSLDEMTPAIFEQAETWSRIALSYDSTRAEPWLILGDVYMKQGYQVNAERMYRIAARRDLPDSPLALLHTYYNEIPHDRLAAIMYDKGLIENALLHASIASQANPSDERLLRQRGEVIQRLLLDQVNKLAEWDKQMSVKV